MARRNSVEIVLSAQDQASREIERSVRRTTREFGSLNRSLRSVGLNSRQIDQIDNRIRDVNPQILENELENVRIKLRQLGVSSQEIEKITNELKAAENEADDAGNGMDDMFGLGKAGAAGLGAAIAAAAMELGKYVAEVDALDKKMAAATGASGAALKDMEASYDRLYTSARGTKEEISETLILTKQTFRDIDSSGLEKIANKALIIKQTFGIDVSESLTSVDVLMKNFGITADQAFDLITRGAQEGLNRNGDLMDTITEYSPQFKAMKYDAGEFFTILNNGMIAGARNTDVVADTVKEFNIRIKDGSKTTSDALEKLYGKDYPALKTELEKTGRVGKDQMQEIIKKLVEMKDPIQRNQAGVQLFGTKWEDLEEVAVTSLTSTKGQLKNVEGATKQAGNTIDTSLTAKWNRFKNSVLNFFTKSNNATQGGSTGLGINKMVNDYQKGLKDGKPKVEKAAEDVAEGMADYLRFRSPTKKGPASDSDKWPTRFTDMFAGGLSKGKGKVEKAAAEQAEALKNAIDKTISEADRFGSQLTSALRKRYDKQERLQLDWLNNEVENARKATDEKIKLYDREYAAKLKTLNAEEAQRIKTIQDQIEGINNKTDEEEKALKEQEYKTRITELQKKIAVAESAEERASIQKQLNEEVARQERQLLLESRQDKIESLRQEMENIRTQADAKKEQLKADYDAKKENQQKILDNQVRMINKEMDYWKEHYAKLKEEDKLQAEARKMILKGNQEDMIKLLGEYEPQWQDAGRSFGEKLVEGLNSAKQSMRSTLNTMLSNTSKARSSYSAYSGGGGSPNPGVGFGKGAATGVEASINERRLSQDKDFASSELDRANKVIENRKSAGKDTSLQEKYRDNVKSKLSKYHTGGEVTKLGPKEVPAILREGEIVVNPDGLPKDNSGGSQPIVINLNFSNAIFSGGQDFKRFVKNEIAPAVSEIIGRKVLKNRKV